MAVSEGWKGAVAALAGAALAGAAFAEAGSDADLARDDRINQLERKVEVLTEELARTRAEQAVPEEPTPLESIFGLGPAASKVYQVTRGLSLGGYGEGYYKNIVGDKGTASDRTDLLRLVLYTGYKFTDRILFNSEIEFEHATTGGSGEVSVEFANLDFKIIDEASVRVGLLLIPMGFINEMHEPPFFLGVNRPSVERFIIPATWRENGAGVYGRLFGESLEYKLYVVNGFNATGFSAAGIRGGRQNGSEALAEDLAFVGSVDYTPWEPVLVGGSVYYGKTGQSQPGIPDAPLHLFEFHGQYEAHGLHLRALFAMSNLGDSGDLTTALRASGDIALTETVGEQTLGSYGEIGYDVLPLLFPDTEMSLEPFFRYEYYDTQYQVPSGFTADDAYAIEVHTVGFSFKPIPQVVIKADYRSQDAKGGAEAPDEFNIGMGFVF